MGDAFDEHAKYLWTRHRDPARLVLYWRFLETHDEYFPYAETPFPPQGFWRIYGADLPDDVLKKLYSDNAPAVKRTGE